MRRFLAPVLSLALVPVLVFATPTTARAANGYTAGDWAGATVELPGLAGVDTTCKVNAHKPDPTSVEIANSVCMGPAGGDVRGGKTYQIRFEGLDEDGNGCTAGGAGVFTEHEDDTWTKELSRMERETFVVPLASLIDRCDFTKVCIELGSGSVFDHCAGISLPAPTKLQEAPTSVCPHLDVQSVEFEWVTSNPGGTPTNPYRWVKITVKTVKKVVSPSVDLAVMMQFPVRGDAAARGVSNLTETADGYVAYAQSFDTQANTTVRGVQVIANGYRTAGTTAQKNMGPQPHLVWQAAATDNGWSDPGNCAWYVGTKYAAPAYLYQYWTVPAALMWPSNTATTSSTATTEPFAPLGVTPPPVEQEPPAEAAPVADVENGDACTFDWGDPTTWASAGICAVVHLLTKIWGTLTAIPGAVLDGLQILFEPHPDSWGVSGVMAQAEERPPFSLAFDGAEALKQTAAGYESAGSDCGSLPAFDIPGVGATSLCTTSFRSTTMGAALYALASFALVSLTGWGIAQLIAARARGAS